MLVAVVILLIGLWLARRISRALSGVLERAKVEAMLAAFFGNVAYAVVLALVLVTALDAIGVPPTSLFAVVGAAGLAVGLPLKDSLANISAGVRLIVLRPFHTGDTVQIAGVTGVVERDVHLQLPDKVAGLIGRDAAPPKDKALSHGD